MQSKYIPAIRETKLSKSSLVFFHVLIAGQIESWALFFYTQWLFYN